jgi:uncharacterized protein YkwD
VTRSLRIPALLAAFALATPALAASAPSPTVAEQYLLAAANQERAARGLTPLHRDPNLAVAAEQHARVMASHQSISHQFAGEPELAARAAAAGAHFSVVEENVAEGPNPITLHTLWMHSPHHRENLLNPAIDSAGIGVVSRNGQLYAVEDFARAVRPERLSDQEAAIASLLTQHHLRIASGPANLAAARETCAMETGYAGTRRPWFIMRFTTSSLDALPPELTARLASGKYHEAAVGACPALNTGNFTGFNLAVLLYP